MELVYKGKTKDVFKNNDGNYVLKFKDDMTGTDGVFDPGANTVGLTVPGAGKSGLRLSVFFFEKIKAKDIPTHFVSAEIENSSMTVLPATQFGKGLELILRYKAVGSFFRRYGRYCNEGDDLPGFVEITLKDDEHNDPPICKDGLVMLGILSADEFDTLVQLTREIGAIVKDELLKKDLVLYDIKFEFGRVGKDGHIALVDEISGGNMRAYKNGKYIMPFDLERIMLSD